MWFGPYHKLPLITGSINWLYENSTKMFNLSFGRTITDNNGVTII